MKMHGYYDGGWWHPPVQVERAPSSRGCAFQPREEERRLIGERIRAGHRVRFAGLEHVWGSSMGQRRCLRTYVLIEVDGMVQRCDGYRSPAAIAAATGGEREG